MPPLGCSRFSASRTHPIGSPIFAERASTISSGCSPRPDGSSMKAALCTRGLRLNALCLSLMPSKGVENDAETGTSAPGSRQATDRCPTASGCGGSYRLPRWINDGERIKAGSRQRPASNRADGRERLYNFGCHRNNEEAMPPRKQPPRLWLRPARKLKRKKTRAQAVWIILDGGRHIATGCLSGEDSEAQQALRDYIAQKYTPTRKERDIESIAIADVLSIYVDDCGARQVNQPKFYERITRINDFWGAKMLADVTGESCRAYIVERGNNGGARRDLEDLRAAINHHAKQGFHRGIVRVTLPPKGKPRDRWLTRQEAAKLLMACWRHREEQVRHRGPNKGQKLPTDKRPLRHLARFILIGLYTGTRAAAIASASPIAQEGRSFVDLDNGIFYRLAQGKQATNKRQPPVPIPARLLAHLRRWKAKGIAHEHFVEWNGKPIKSVKTAFRSAVALAELPGRITPHTLRHTAATWLMQLGVGEWQASGFLGMNVETLRNVYGHHHPDHLREAADAIGRHKPVSLVISLVNARKRREQAPQTIENIGGPGRT